MTRRADVDLRVGELGVASVADREDAVLRGGDVGKLTVLCGQHRDSLAAGETRLEPAWLSSLTDGLLTPVGGGG